MSSWLLLPVATAASAVLVYALLLCAGDWGEGRGLTERQERQACDVVASTLLSTHDAVELRRAEILARHIRCDVARRVVPPLIARPQ
jgi:hypothetical protein